MARPLALALMLLAETGRQVTVAVKGRHGDMADAAASASSSSSAAAAAAAAAVVPWDAVRRPVATHPSRRASALAVCHPARE